MDAPRKITLQMTDGNSTTYQIAGDLLFQYADQTCRLEAFISADNKSLFVPFRDQTSGRETYGGGRFLEADRPKDGRTILDSTKPSIPTAPTVPMRFARSCLAKTESLLLYEPAKRWR